VPACFAATTLLFLIAALTRGKNAAPSGDGVETH
jgi:hypothetical protein